MGILEIFVLCLGICAKSTMGLTNSFTHPHSTTVRLMHLLELTGVAEQAHCHESDGHRHIVFRYRTYMFVHRKCSAH